MRRKDEKVERELAECNEIFEIKYERESRGQVQKVEQEKLRLLSESR